MTLFRTDFIHYWFEICDWIDDLANDFIRDWFDVGDRIVDLANDFIHNWFEVTSVILSPRTNSFASDARKTTNICVTFSTLLSS